MLGLTSTSAIWSNGSTPTFGWNKGGGQFRAENLQYLWNEARQDQGFYDGLIGSLIGAFDYQNQTFDDLERLTHTFAEKMRVTEPTTKIRMKIDPYYQRQKFRPITLVSGGIRYMRLFAGVPREGGVKHTQWGCPRRYFSAFSVAIHCVSKKRANFETV